MHTARIDDRRDVVVTDTQRKRPGWQYVSGKQRLIIHLLLLTTSTTVDSWQPPRRGTTSRALWSKQDASETFEKLQCTLDQVDNLLTNADAGLPPTNNPKGLQDGLLPSRVPNLMIVALGTCAVSIGIGELLSTFEWFQAWRYLWPMVGGLYVVDVFSDVLPFDIRDNQLTKMTAFVCGFGLIIGGAYDAFMPVWQTGPDILTNAGIGQDSAAVLFLLSILSISSKQQQPTNTRTLLQMTLLGELYNLGEGSFDEILLRLSDFFHVP